MNIELLRTIFYALFVLLLVLTNIFSAISAYRRKKQKQADIKINRRPVSQDDIEKVLYECISALIQKKIDSEKGDD